MIKTYATYQNQLKYFQSNDGRIAYFDKGVGKCILLLHGVPTSSWLYRKIIFSLLKAGYRVVVPDMLGFGSSDKPLDYELYSSQNTGRRILELMDFLKIKKWTHVFHDAGGLWTWAMLHQTSSNVEHLIMLNTIVYQEGFKPPFTLKKGLLANWYSKLYSIPLAQRIMFYMTMRGSLNDKSVIDKNMLDGYKLPLRKTGHPAMYYFFTQISQELPDFTFLHRSLKMPLSVIWGKSDDVLLFENIKKRILNNFKTTESHIHILNGKHFIQEENATQLSKLILFEMEAVEKY